MIKVPRIHRPTALSGGLKPLHVARQLRLSSFRGTRIITTQPKTKLQGRKSDKSLCQKFTSSLRPAQVQAVLKKTIFSETARQESNVERFIANTVAGEIYWI